MFKLTRPLLCLALAASATLHAGTSLSKVVIDGNLDATKAKIQAGENVNEYDKWGWTPLHWAVYYKYEIITEYLLSKGADPNLPATKSYSSLKVKATPLIITGYYGMLPFAEMLLKHGAKVDMADESGMKAADYAKQYEFTDVYDLLTRRR
jgi:ankyrin repeat protein